MVFAVLERRLPEAPPATVDPPAALSRRSEVVEVHDGPVLRASDIEVAFGGNKAVDRASITVAPGEVVGLIGTNGAGKSTLMNAIGGYLPAGGTVELFGRDVSSLSAAKRSELGFGRTFQAARLFPELTVRETVLVALEGRGRSGFMATALFSPWAAKAERVRRREASDLIGFLGLGRYADVHVGDLSTGTRRIVELAGLLALDARLLCLDEPTAGVAQRETEAFGPLMLRIREELDASMLIIEHDMPLIMAVSDRVYCLEQGQVIAEGEPVDVRNNPLVVASYLGTDQQAIDRSDS
jgi:ABC-type branched-subunit amino acid transport system ATPase component